MGNRASGIEEKSGSEASKPARANKLQIRVDRLTLWWTGQAYTLVAPAIQPNSKLLPAFKSSRVEKRPRFDETSGRRTAGDLLEIDWKDAIEHWWLWTLNNGQWTSNMDACEMQCVTLVEEEHLNIEHWTLMTIDCEMQCVTGWGEAPAVKLSNGPTFTSSSHMARRISQGPLWISIESWCILTT